MPQVADNNFLTKLKKPAVMGILNITPDSFYDGGRYVSFKAAIDRAYEMVEQGAEIIDIGGESTRPRATPVAESEELKRVIPVIQHLAPRLSLPISIDTKKPKVMAEALAAGATMINDVNALQAPGALELAAKQKAMVCLMYAKRQGGNTDLLANIQLFLRQRISVCLQAGIQRQNIIVDPGFGFTLEPQSDKFMLLTNLEKIAKLGYPLLVGLSRKSLDIYASISAAVIAAMKGAAIVRTHDVKETVAALSVVREVFKLSSLD